MAISRMTKVISSAADLLTVAVEGPESNLGIVIGIATRGPAFVPVSFSDHTTFSTRFGKPDSTNFAKIAMWNWLTYSNGSYLRLLGVGDGTRRKKTGENAGSVNRAGWVVGEQQILTSSGFVSNNHRAHTHGDPGRTYFLGAFMSESEGSTIFSDAGLQTSPTAVPVIRGIIMAASGVILSLASNATNINTPLNQKAQGTFGATKDAGLSFGDVNTRTGDKQEIVLLLNGHKSTDDYKNALTASLDPTAVSTTPSDSTGTPTTGYFADVFNTDPTKLQEAGHFLYTYYDLDAKFTALTGTQLTAHVDDTADGGDGAKKYQTAFILTSSLTRDSGSATKSTVMGIPNYENFQNRFTTPFSPYVISQEINGKIQNLFRIHSLHDGKFDAYPQRGDSGLATEAETGHQGVPLKITIRNVQPSKQVDEYATFDLLVRRFDSNDFDDLVDGSITVLETYTNLDLNPKSQNFIAKRIGDMHTYYDFDKKQREQRLVKEGFYPNVSNLIRVEIDKVIQDGNLNKDAMPIGFRGIHHLVTSGSGRCQPTGNLVPFLTGTAKPLVGSEGSLASYHGISNDIVARVTQPPIPFRENLIGYADPTDTSTSYEARVLSWGIQFEEKISTIVKNGSILSPLVRSLVEYFPDFHTNYQNPWVGNNEGTQDIGGTVLDADKFNNNFFTLEKIEVITKTDGSNFPDPDEWQAARYRRTGRSEGSLLNTDKTEMKSSRLLNAKHDFFDASDNPITQYLKFTFPLQGGFDGYNRFDADKSSFNNLSANREILDGKQGGRRGSTIIAYKRALQVIEDKMHDFKVLATPGIRSPEITGACIDTVEDRFDTFYIMDVQQIDETGSEMFSLTVEDDDNVNVSNTCTTFIQRNLDANFAAAYFPDLIMSNTDLGITNLRIPPTVAVMGMLSRNDNKFGVGVRPVGHIKGAMQDFAMMPKTILDDADIEKVFLNKINPIASEGSTGLFARSQQTTQNDQSELSRIDIRRLMIEIRRIARRLARRTLFEMNATNTHVAYRFALENSIRGFVASGLIDRFSVDIQKPTPADKQANVFRGVVMIKPRALSQELFIEVDPESP